MCVMLMSTTITSTVPLSLASAVPSPGQTSIQEISIFLEEIRRLSTSCTQVYSLLQDDKVVQSFSKEWREKCVACAADALNLLYSNGLDGCEGRLQRRLKMRGRSKIVVQLPGLCYLFRHRVWLETEYFCLTWRLDQWKNKFDREVLEKTNKMAGLGVSCWMKCLTFWSMLLPSFRLNAQLLSVQVRLWSIDKRNVICRY